MKIEIDLDDILTDEYGGATENISDSIRRQVVEHLTETIKKGIGKQIEAEVGEILNREIQNAVIPQMPTLINDLLNTEYEVVDRWGSREQPTTFRKELIKSIASEMTYKKTQSTYERNAFTKAVDDVIAENLKAFQADFNKEIDGQFLKEAMEYATRKLKERLRV